MISSTGPRRARLAAATWVRIPFLLLLAPMAAACVISLDLGIGTLDVPQAGMWPFITSLFSILIICALLVFPNFAAEGGDAMTAGQWRSLILALPALVSYPLLLSLLGFVIPTAVVSLYWLRVLARRNWAFSLAWSTAITLTMYLVFIHLLAVPFPFGVLPIR